MVKKPRGSRTCWLAHTSPRAFRSCRRWNRFIAGRERSSASLKFFYSPKLRESKFDELEREVRALHSYDTPEIIAVPVVAGSAPYLDG